jgi:hypothetical protein
MKHRQHDYHYNNVVPILMDLFKTSSLFNQLKPLDFNELSSNKKYLNLLNTSVDNRNLEIKFQKELIDMLNNLEDLLVIELS